MNDNEPANESEHKNSQNIKNVLPGFQKIRAKLQNLPWKKLGIGLGVALAALILIFALIIWQLIATAPDIDSIDVSPSGSATWICDEDGNYLRRISLSESNRDIVSLSEIPQDLQNAIIAIEDSRFYEHGGIDLRGILRAFWRGITSGSFSEGASTITQQLIKNNVFTEWTEENSFADRFARKVQEQYLAVQLEKQLSKQEILEDYLNTINFGAGCYGVEAAAQRYFGKDVSDLTLSESAVLAAIPQNPTGYNPIDYPEANQTRQRLVLRYMEEQGFISHEERMEALSDDVYLRISTHNETWETDSVYSYYEDALIEQVTALLVSELHYSQEQAAKAVYSGGLRIYSAQDAALQEICDEEFENLSNFPDGTQYGVDYSLSVQESDESISLYGSDALRSYVRENMDASFDLLCETQDQAQAYADAFREYVLNISDADESSEQIVADNDTDAARTVLSERLTLTPQPQASLVLIEQETGFVRAIVGGRGEKTASLTLNRATGTTRQPGSTFKILTAYAPALDDAGQTLATLYENEPYEYENGTSVSNWDISDYSGIVTIREAITRSINVVAVRCITEITPRLGFTYAEKLGISTLVDDWESGDGSSDVIQPLALGGITNGVTNLELCAAYATIANGGLYGEPLFFTKVLDRNGNILLDASGRSASVSTDTDFGSSTSSDSASSADTFSSLTAQASNSDTITGLTAVSADSDDADSSEQENAFGSFTRVLKASTACLLTSAMEDVVSSTEGTAYGTVSAAGQPVAGKTGTTSGYKDIWFVGYTPYYTCCVWGGYDNNQSLLSDSIGHSYSRVLWTSVMERVHTGLSIGEFTQPKDVVEAELCSDSHLLAQEDCPSVYTEYFAEGTEPEETCSEHLPETEADTESESEIGVPSETEAEGILIYQDILDQLLTETESESETKSAFESESETETGSAFESESEPAAEPESESAAEAETEIAAGSEPESAARSESAVKSDIKSNDKSDSSSDTDSANTKTAPEDFSDAVQNNETSSLDDLLGRLTEKGFHLP